jgi:lipid A 4'-phosphatase
MINSSPPDATSSNPSVNLPDEQSVRSMLPHAQGEAEPAGALPQSTISQWLSAAGKRFRSEIGKPAILLFLAIHALLGLAFYSAPEIDLGVSRLFYTPAEGFALGGRSSTKVLPFVPWITIAFVALLVLLLIRNLVAWRRSRQSPSHLLSIRRDLFLLLTLVIGPGLLINVILKHQSGRSRPIRVEAFGGDRQFTAAFVTTGACRSNCAFVSGDAAMGYYFLAFLFVARKRRQAIALAAYTLGTAIGVLRIAQGAHFLSDVIFAGFFTYLVAWILSMLLLPAQENSATPLAPSFDRH